MGSYHCWGFLQGSDFRIGYEFLQGVLGLKLSKKCIVPLLVFFCRGQILGSGTGPDNAIFRFLFFYFLFRPLQKTPLHMYFFFFFFKKKKNQYAKKTNKISIS